MKKLTTTSVVIGLLATSTLSLATTWNTTSSSSSSCTTNSSNTYGNVRGCTSDGITAHVSAWSNTLNSANTQIQDAYLPYWSGGLGVENRDKNAGDDGEGTQPEHAIDNNQRDEMVLFNFKEGTTDVKVHLTSLNIGWTSTASNPDYDADFSVFAFTGASAPSTLAGQSFASLQSGWELIGHYNASGNGNKTITYSTGKENLASSYWLIGAYNNQVSGTCRNSDGNSIGATSSGCDHGDDYFKLASLTGTKVATCTTNCGNTQVPEPATLGLLGLGLLGMVAARRRKLI